MSVLGTHCDKGGTYHLEEFVALVQMGHNDALALRHAAVDTNELALPTHGIDLMEGELILKRISVSQRSRPRTAGGHLVRTG